jgi:hypothetical protein
MKKIFFLWVIIILWGFPILMHAQAPVISDSIQVGSETTPYNQFGKKIYFGLPGENGADMYMSRFNREFHKTDLRVNVKNAHIAPWNIGRFVLGQTTEDEYIPFFVATSQGRVGIGVEEPEHALDVNGTIQAPSLLLTGGQLDLTGLLLDSLVIGHENTPFGQFGKKVYFGLPAENGTDIYMSRFNREFRCTDLRINVNNVQIAPWNVGRFVLGQTTYEDEYIPFFVATSQGRVGIGVMEPEHALEVNGTIQAPSLLLTGGQLDLTGLLLDSLVIGHENTPFGQFGKKIYFGLPGENWNDVYISRFNTGVRSTDLRVNIKNDSNFPSGLGRFVLGKTSNEDEYIPLFAVTSQGRVGIGVAEPENALDVNGIIRAKEVKIETDWVDWADFVFSEDYRLRPLSEVNDFILQHKHLPEIPSASEVKQNDGVNLGEMQTKLLQKIEELTLYLIRQEQKIEEQDATIRELKGQVEQLQKQ